MINEQAIKDAFDRAKADIKALKGEIKQIKQVLEEIRAEVKALKEAPEPEDSTPLDEDSTQSSTGNQGVLNIHINKQTHKQINKPSLKDPSKHINKQINRENGPVELFTEQTSKTYEKIEFAFKSLTKQEFRVFLLIYQLEDEEKIPTYQDLASRLTLTLGCLRSYICSLIQKGVPLNKKKLRDNSIILFIDKDFKAFASQKKLIDIYYSQISPDQTKLSGL